VTTRLEGDGRNSVAASWSPGAVAGQRTPEGGRQRCCLLRRSECSGYYQHARRGQKGAGHGVLPFFRSGGGSITNWAFSSVWEE